MPSRWAAAPAVISFDRLLAAFGACYLAVDGEQMLAPTVVPAAEVVTLTVVLNRQLWSSCRKLPDIPANPIKLRMPI